MADKEIVQLLDERIISNRGLIVHTIDTAYRRFWLQVDVIRRPQIDYTNKNINPDLGDYGRITFMRQGQVLRVERIQFDQQVYTWDVDQAGYIAKALLCMYDSIIVLMQAIAVAVGVSPVDGVPIYCEPIEDQFDQILFVVRPDAAIAAQLYGLKYDLACEAAEQEPNPPPPPPDFPNYPPATPLEETDTPASEPYDPPNDSGDTVPLPGDTAPLPPPPLEPPGEACVKYRIVIRHRQNYGETYIERETIMYGEIGEPFITPSGAANALVLPSRGFAIPGFDEGCLGSQENRTVFVSDSVSSAEAPTIVLFEEYTE